MTHDELLAEIDSADEYNYFGGKQLNSAFGSALRAVVELHFPDQGGCSECHGFMDRDIEGWKISYPCATIRSIEKELE